MKNIFKMSKEEFDEYLESDEFKEIADKFVEYFDKEVKHEPWFYSEECWNMQCKHNKYYKEFLEMGCIPYCTKYKENEENICELIKKDY